MNKKKVLVLEDHQGLRTLLTDLLKMNGYDVTATSNGMEGYEKAREGGYDVIITDIKMPEMDGVTFLRTLREHPPKEKNGPIIVYSNFAYEYSKDEVLSLGASEFVAKDTVSTGELLQIMDNLLKPKTSTI